MRNTAKFEEKEYIAVNSKKCGFNFFVCFFCFALTLALSAKT